MHPSYIYWHYHIAPKQIRTILKNYLEFIPHLFSFRKLLKTLFSPWKRTVVEKNYPGFNVQRMLDQLSFNTVSRIMGFGIRITTIFAGLCCLVGINIFGGLFLLFWYITPYIWYPLYHAQNKPTETDLVLLAPNDQLAMKAMLTTRFGQFIVWRLGIKPEYFESCIGPSNYLSMSTHNKLITLSIPIFFQFLFLQYQTLQTMLDRIGIRSTDIQFIIWWFEELEKDRFKHERFWDREQLLKTPSFGRSWNYGYTPNLSQLTTDLSATPIPFGAFHGRKKEFDTIERILMKKAGNNVLLVGEPGVGKQPLLVHFAHEVTAGRVYPEIEGKRVMKLEVERVLGGQLDSSQRKAALTYLLDEAHNAGDVILIIDSFDRFVSEGQDRMDLTDVFVHALTNSDFRIIADVTPEAYHQYIANNPLIVQFFEKIDMLPVGKEETLEILTEILPVFEQKHFFRYQTLREIVDVADRYVKDKPFPDSAINILDLTVTSITPVNEGYKVVVPEDIKTIVSTRLKIPITLGNEEKNMLLDMERLMHERVIGQNDAISSVANAIRRNRADVSAKKGKPIGSFLFLGPTGVGKTETAKSLAFIMFGSEKNLIRFDMSEFQEEEAIKRFLGDFSTGKVGILTSKIRETPYTVLLLDEFEKANPKLLNIFLSALDEGIITDAFGDKVHLDNTIIIATSNAGAEYIRQLINTKPSVTQDEIQSLVLEYVQKQHIFAPELINRFDASVVFHPINRDQAFQILELFITKLNQSLKISKGITFSLCKETEQKILNEGFDPTYGGRSLSRAIQSNIEDIIAQKILKNEIHHGDVIEI
jgi:ATP-dependent Clp protease ATP-binding subunit ClpC